MEVSSRSFEKPQGHGTRALVLCSLCTLEYSSSSSLTSPQLIRDGDQVTGSWDGTEELGQQWNKMSRFSHYMGFMSWERLSG